MNLIIIDKQLDILKEENKELGIFYKRKETKIYLVTDKIVDHKLPENIEIINVNMHKEQCDLNNEANNMKKFYEIYKNYDKIEIPELIYSNKYFKGV